MAVYDLGDRIRIGNHAASGAAAFADPAGTPTNTTAVLTVERPDGTTSTPALTNESAGRYYADVTLDQAGRWRYRLAGTGTVVAAAEDWFQVRRSLI